MTDLPAKYIFSGPRSESLWADINKLHRKVKGRKKHNKLALRCWNAVYFLGCRCQELEVEVKQLRKEIDAIKGKAIP